MGAGNPQGMSRVAETSLQQATPNLRAGAQAELQARAGFQQKGPAFERFMQDRAFQDRMSDQQRQAVTNQMHQQGLARQRMEEARAAGQRRTVPFVR